MKATEHPQVLVVTRRTARKNKWIDYVGEYHLELLLRLGTLPVMVPVVPGAAARLPQYMAGMRGLLLVEGEDIEPKRYPAEPEHLKYLEKTHPLKDEIEIRLLRRALRLHIPILGICRGSQLLNVVCGGTLHIDVLKEKSLSGNSPSRAENPSPRSVKEALKHIDYEHYDTYRHPIAIVPGTPLQRWYRRTSLRVNSYHHQGIRTLARRFTPMAYAEDGLVEAYFDPAEDFLVGLQFHPERMLEERAGNWRIWRDFGAAIARRHSQNQTNREMLAESRSDPHGTDERRIAGSHRGTRSSGRLQKTRRARIQGR
jgi:gamma-glutamyl-gamma-aminobutyrate hydrolase PuuD